jgi:hypothetical protein
VYQRELTFIQERRLQFMMAAYYDLFRGCVDNPCTTRPVYCGDNLSKLDNPPMTAAWVEKPCPN